MSAEFSDGRAASNSIEVSTASRGDDGLTMARAHGFDVAIVDVKLPDTSGVDLIPVSYTHLDVYKRQMPGRTIRPVQSVRTVHAASVERRAPSPPTGGSSSCAA